jgi:hypothetical protein
MTSKSIVGSFSYHVRDMEIVEQAEKMAAADGISFSEFLLSLLKEEVHRKKVIGGNGCEPDSLGLSRLSMQLGNIMYSTNKDKPSFQSLITQWTEKVKNMHNPQEIGAHYGYHKRMLEICKVHLERVKNEREIL